jgi:hypothetical protein
MKPTRLHAGDKVIYNDGWSKPRKMTFVERIPGCGRVRPTVNVFRSNELGLTTMSDHEVLKRIELTIDAANTTRLVAR